MKPKLLIILTAILFSCNSSVQVKSVTLDSIATGSSSKDTVAAQVAIPADTSSIDYLIYLLNNEKPLNYNWTQKLKALDVELAPWDSMARFTFNRAWKMNDSITALILGQSTGTSLDEYLITVKGKKDLIAMVHILNNVDADPGEEHPDHYYTEFKQIDERNMKVFMHKIVNYDRPNEKDIIDSVENWFILNDGRVKKTKGR
ncbi:MAG TPA: hypothetical protein VIM79_09475 [Niastella sp.]